MSKKKKKPRTKKRKSSPVTRLPNPLAPPSRQDPDRELSEVIEEMAMRLLSKPGADAATQPASTAVGSALGMHDELVRVIGLMQESRMGVHVHQGVEQDTVVLRELVTDRVCSAISPSGYRGRRGELWYVRVLPPPAAGLAEHVVFGTPYPLLEPGEYDWQAYFRRTLPDAPIENRIAAYEHHTKFRPARDYWTEFVFEAYVNHRFDVIFPQGLPDVPESRPHSGVNS